MIDAAIRLIETLVVPLGGWGVFLATVIEEVIAPIPSPLVMMAAGFFFLSGDFSLALLRDLLFTVALPGAFGVAFGSLLVFGLVYVSGKPALTKWGKWFGLSWEDIEKIQKKFSQSRADELTIFLLRAVPAVPSVAIAAFCGLIRMKITSYLFVTFLGTLVRAFFLGLLGWKVGSLYYVYADTIKRFEDLTLLIILAGIGIFIFWGVKRKRDFQEKKNVL